MNAAREDGIIPTVAIVTFDYDSLPTVTALKLRQAVIDIREAQSATMSAIAEIGSRLITVKTMLSHGSFTTWLAAEIGLTARTAEHYMSAARFLDGKPKCVSHLPAHIIYKLSAPSTAPEIVNDVVAASEAGAPLAVKEIAGRLTAAVQRSRYESQEVERVAVLTQGGRRRRRKLTREQAIEEIDREKGVREREKAECKSRLAPLAERVIGALGDDLLREVLGVLDNCQDHSPFIDLLRNGRASAGGE